jgi:hypothetical protein
MEAKTKKIFIATSIIGAIVIGVTAIILTSRKKKVAALVKAGSKDVIAPASATLSGTIFPLQSGSGTTTADNNAVKVVQRYLNAKGSNLTEDGLFGPNTTAALLSTEAVSQVSLTLYNSMVDYLSSQVNPVPDLLSPDAQPYSSSTDPTVAKNDLTSNDILNTFL